MHPRWSRYRRRCSSKSRLGLSWRAELCGAAALIGGSLFCLARRFLLASDAFDSLWIEWFGCAAVQAILDVLAEALQFKGAQLILLLQKAQGFADHFAR